MVNQVVADWKTAELEERDQRLCEFAAKLTKEQYKMTSQDLETLRSSGFCDRSIHDAVQVIGYFNYITRIADSLGVEPEESIRHWG